MMRGQCVYYTLVQVHLNITVELPGTRLRPRLLVELYFTGSAVLQAFCRIGTAIGAVGKSLTGTN